MMDLVAHTFLVVGALFMLLAAVGVVRFDDVYSRMHAAAKGPALGVILLGAGAALSIRTMNATVVVILVIVLQLIGGPVGTHLLGRSVYRRSRPPLMGPDELEPVVEAEETD
jgi:multicomponent Na+:H+ antiporter subunit G